MSHPRLASERGGIEDYGMQCVSERHEDDRSEVHTLPNTAIGIYPHHGAADPNGNHKEEQNHDRVDPSLPDGYDEIDSECDKACYGKEF